MSLMVFATDFITFLLQRLGTYVDPRILVQRIDCGMEIPGLKNSLVKLMRDYSLQVIYFPLAFFLSECLFKDLIQCIGIIFLSIVGFSSGRMQKNSLLRLF